MGDNKGMSHFSYVDFICLCLIFCIWQLAYRSYLVIIIKYIVGEVSTTGVLNVYRDYPCVPVEKKDENWEYFHDEFNETVPCNCSTGVQVCPEGRSLKHYGTCLGFDSRVK